MEKSKGTRCLLSLEERSLENRGHQDAPTTDCKHPSPPGSGHHYGAMIQVSARNPTKRSPRAQNQAIRKAFTADFGQGLGGWKAIRVVFGFIT